MSHQFLAPWTQLSTPRPPRALTPTPESERLGKTSRPTPKEDEQTSGLLIQSRYLRFRGSVSSHQNLLRPMELSYSTQLDRNLQRFEYMQVINLIYE